MWAGWTPRVLRTDAAGKFFGIVKEMAGKWILGGSRRGGGSQKGRSTTQGAWCSFKGCGFQWDPKVPGAGRSRNQR